MTRGTALRATGPRHLALALSVALAACDAKPPALFESLEPRRTGIAFSNDLPEDTSFNILNYLYYYNGGGVAVGDIDNDGLPDLYFTSNRGANRLYRNKGGYRFEDVTERAGVADSVGWKSGVTMADVNGDGFIDIYVCGVAYLGVRGRNVLYVNNGNGTFTDRTREYGLEFAGYSTQSMFFDYDGDGDLDMFLLNHSVHTEHGTGSIASRAERHPRAGPRLYRNDGGHFADVTAAAGIYGGAFGYGLGVVGTDFDGDGCMDVYVANDFQEDDFLYRNNCDGTFTDVAGTMMTHTSRSSMGVDAADVNNDARPDMIIADMLPDRDDILRSSATVESFTLFTRKREAGYRPQLAHNTLQLNRADGRFSEVAFLARVAATDWSWAPLFADLDNDGRKDLFMTTGIPGRPNDLDYLAEVGRPGAQAALRAGITPATMSLVRRMPRVALPNRAFRNVGPIAFDDATTAWGLSATGFSNGAAYVDLNNSGALDLVVNRINAPAAIYRNRAREVNGWHFLRVVLRGLGANTDGIGARVFVVHGATTQLLEQQPTRGFQSSVDRRLHFGLGATAVVDTVKVVWPDGRVQLMANVDADRTLTFSQQAAAVPDSVDARRSSADERRAAALAGPEVIDVTSSVGLTFIHREGETYDFAREPLLPRVLSAEGPALAAGDVNGDGLQDVFVGGAKWQPGELFLQQRDGRFRRSPQPAFESDSLFESVAAAIFDADGNGTADLYVVSGGHEFAATADALQDRLYLNDGHGTFRRAPAALPRLSESGSCVAVGDFNRDGYPDLFIGRRAVLGAYGVSPRAYLLQNDGRGNFRDVSAAIAPELVTPGMVTAAAWLDADGDAQLDLVVTGEWMPVRVFRQENGRFTDRTAAAGLDGSNGWWSSVTVADLNADGRPDLVLGNIGLNSALAASRKSPIGLYAGDFARDGRIRPILTRRRNAANYPLAGRDELTPAIPDLATRYPTHAAFVRQSIDDLLPRATREAATRLEAYELATSVAINQGRGLFALQALPAEAQVSVVRAAIAGDFTGDGRIDLLLAGNDWGFPPALGRFDASYGLMLRGLGDGRFSPETPRAGGLVLEGQVRHIMPVPRATGGDLLVVARNNAPLQVLRISRSLIPSTPP